MFDEGSKGLQARRGREDRPVDGWDTVASATRHPFVEPKLGSASKLLDVAIWILDVAKRKSKIQF